MLRIVGGSSLYATPRIFPAVYGAIAIGWARRRVDYERDDEVGSANSQTFYLRRFSQRIIASVARYLAALLAGIAKPGRGIPRL
jgi:hypothetical protein